MSCGAHNDKQLRASHHNEQRRYVPKSWQRSVVRDDKQRLCATSSTKGKKWGDAKGKDPGQTTPRARTRDG